MDIEKLKKLFEDSTFSKDMKFDWEGFQDRILKGGDRFIYVPQGSHLGDTLIVFEDAYEGSGEDALFISELLKEFIKEIKK